MHTLEFLFYGLVGFPILLGFIGAVVVDVVRSYKNKRLREHHEVMQMLREHKRGR